MSKIVRAGWAVSLPCLIAGCSGQPSSQSSNSASVAAVPRVASISTSLTARRGVPCGRAGRVTQTDYAVAKEGVLRAAPHPDATPVIVKVGDGQIAASLEEDSTIREICRDGGWSEVRVLTAPKELQPLRGWVPTSVMRKVSTTAEGRRVYAAGDFDWPAGSGNFRGAAVRVLNRIMAERPACDALDTSSLIFDSSTGTFSIPCFDGGDMQSVDFVAADATNGRSFAPVEPLIKTDA